MKKTGSFVAVAAALALFSCTEKKADSVRLFNGTDLTGWVLYMQDSTLNPQQEFVVRDSVIALSGPFGYVRTDKAYSNYKLNAQWRWPDSATNSGIFVNIQQDGIWPDCYECQLWAGHAGDVNDAGDSQSDEFRRIGAATVPKLQPASEKPAGEWNDVEIVCDGNAMTIFINGVLQNKLTRMNNDRGYIALEGEGSPILFRNIEVAPLKRKR